MTDPNARTEPTFDPDAAPQAPDATAGAAAGGQQAALPPPPPPPPPGAPAAAATHATGGMHDREPGAHANSPR
ncbi:MAG TPA: hypothetical protein PKC20_07485, partial [Burkholderiaceae bacterium]|nr:hypothetical protein [Burkholderiaceae bacterium]